MAANPIIVPITPPRVAFLDARGFISREWYRFLLSLATQVESGAIDVDILMLAPEAVTPDQIAVLEAQIQALALQPSSPLVTVLEDQIQDLALQPLPPLLVPDPNNMKYVPVSGGDDTATIQALINAGLNTLYFHAATYSYTTLTITTPVRFCGVVSSIDGAPATVLNRTGANASTGITFGAIASPQLSGILVENIVFTATVATGGVLMQFNHCADVIVRGCQFLSLNSTAKAIGFQQVNTLTVTDTRIINPTTSGIYGESDDTHRSDILNLTRVIISGDSTGAHTYIPNAVELNGFVNTLCLTDCEFVNPGRGIYRHNTIGATPRPEFISSTNLQVDYPYYEGVRLAAGNSAFFADSYIHGSVTTQNVYVGHNAVNTIDNISFIGGQCTGAYLAGMYLDGNYQKVIGMEISGNGAQSSGTYPGIEIGADSQSTLITGNHIGERAGYQTSTQSYGVKIDSGAMQVVIANNDLRDNVTGTILNGGDGSNSEYILGPNLGITTPDSFATKVVTTGFNVAFGPSALQYDVSHMSFFPAGTLATGTLTLFTKPADFQSLTVFSTQTITALTLTPGAGQSISATCPTTISARGFISLFYNPSDATWYPCAESSGSPSGVISFNTRTGAVTLTSADVTGALGFTPANINNPRFTGNLEVNDVNYYLNVTSSNPYLNFDTTDYLTYDRTANTLTTVIGGSNVLSVSAAAVQVPVKMEVTDANYYLTVTSSTPYLNFDTNDYISYTRSSNTMNFVIGGSTLATVTATGADLLGSPTATTASPGDNTTRISTTAFVTAAVTAAATGVSSFNTRTGAVTLTSGDVTGALGFTPANINNPRFTGNLEVNDVNYYLTVTSSTPYLNFDTSDYLSYTRSSNTMNFAIGGSNVFTLTAAAATFATAINYGGVTLSNSVTGTGSMVLSTSPTLVTPVLGAATATSINGLTVTTSTGALTIANGKTLTQSNTLTFTGTDGSSVNFGAGGTVLYSSGSYVTSITGTANEITASASTGAVTLSLPAALTFTGKTVTGGTFASPTISGTVAGAHSYSGALTLSAALTYGGVTLSNSVTGTGSMALSANPRFTGNLEVTDANYYLTVTSSTPYLNFDTNDYISYTRSTNTMNFVVGSSTIASITAAGLGIGITPSSWATFNVAQVGLLSIASYTNGDTDISSNLYYNAGWKYIGTGRSAQIQLDSSTSGGDIKFWVDATGGTAGGATAGFEAARITASGNLQIMDANYYLTVTSSTPYLNFDTNDYISYTRSSNTMNFVIGASTIAVVTSTGLGIGTTTPVGSLSIVTPTSTGNTTTAWTSAYVVVGTGAGSTTGKAIGLGFNTTSNQAEILALAPNVSWYPLNLFSNGVIFSSTAGVEAARLNSSGVLLLGETSSTPTGGGTFRLGIAGNIKFDSGGVIEFPTSGGAAWYLYDSSAALIFQRGGTEAARFGTSRNLYLGTTAASDLDTGQGAVLGPSGIFGSVVAYQAISGGNAYYTGAAWKTIRTQTGYAVARYNATSAGAFSWHGSSSAYTAGDNLPNMDGSDIKMALNASGNLSVGTTGVEGVLTVGKTSPTNGRIAVFTNLIDTNIIFPLSSGSCGIGTGTNNPFLFYMNGSEVARFTTGGNLQITDANYYLTVTSSTPYLNFDSNDYISYTRSSNTMNFVVGSTTIATVTSAGLTATTVIGTATNSASFTGAGNTASVAGYGMYVFGDFSGSGALFAFHRPNQYAVNMGLDSDNVIRIGGWSAAASRWQLDMSGNMYAAGAITAYSSDVRLKENIVVIDNAISKVKQLRGVYFDWKPIVDSLGFTPTDRHDIGVIAQEILAVIPQAVKPAPFDHGDNGSISGENYVTVQLEKIIPLLIEVAKEQQVLIEALTFRISTLETRQ